MSNKENNNNKNNNNKHNDNKETNGQYLNENENELSIEAEAEVENEDGVDSNSNSNSNSNRGRNIDQQESYSSMINNNVILLSFEGWIKYVEGFTRGLSTTKTVDASSVFDVVGEILEYMKTLKTNLSKLLIYCENTLEENEKLQNKISSLEDKLKLITTKK